MIGNAGWQRALSGVLLTWFLGGTWACSTPNPSVRARRLLDGRVEVEGPLAGPFQTTEELAAKSCEIMTSQPGASNGVYGFEYCALAYYSHAGSGFFLSFLSDIRNKLDSQVKTCLRPALLNDKSHPDAVTVGDGHNHPHNRRFSSQDLSAAVRWYPDRIVDKHSGQVWHRQLMLFYREKTGECRAYAYDNVSQVVSALRDAQWVPIGKVYDDIGNIKMLDGMDWLP